MDRLQPFEAPRIGFVIWLTGVPGVGKTTLANLLADRLRRDGLKVEILDGDIVRKGLSADLSFTHEDRSENIRRITSASEEMTRCGINVIVAAVSPYREDRDRARLTLRKLVEIFLMCPIEQLVKRDLKGHYKRAIAGEIPLFTGVSDTYEPPLRPELVIDTSCRSASESLEAILSCLDASGLR
jgi:adenylyl-sulfate kinase